MGFGALTVLDQIGQVAGRVNDPRGSLPTHLPPLDALLHRGGLSPSTMVILGGRTHTRKTTLTANLIARMLKAKRNVGLVGLDEAVPQYVLKVMSAMYGVPHENIEENWNDEGGRDLQAKFMVDAKRLTMTTGYRPTFDDLSVWLEEAELEGHRPEVVFLDYISLMARGKYDGSEVQRVMRLVEGLQVWTNEQEVVTIALHQLNREGDDGERPVHLKDLKYGGEEIADIVMATYRPALDPIGNMDADEAEQMEGVKLDDWEKRRDRVERYKDSTLVQLLKNRPGVHLDHRGIELLSVGSSMKMRTPTEGANTEEVTDAVSERV